MKRKRKKRWVCLHFSSGDNAAREEELLGSLKEQGKQYASTQSEVCNAWFSSCGFAEDPVQQQQQQQRAQTTRDGYNSYSCKPVSKPSDGPVLVSPAFCFG